MSGDRIAMSQRERDVLKVMAPVREGKRTQAEAARLLKRSVRQIRRIQRRLEEEEDVGVVHGLRGRPSNHRLDPGIRSQALRAYRQRYLGFGPTLAAEKLSSEGLAVSDETLRNWLLAEGLWERKRRRDRHRRRRQRRECFGELVQADGSLHDWLEGRGEPMVLLVMIDDATSKVVARFYPSEDTQGYMDLLWRYMRKHGRMVALYTDHDSVFCGEGQDRKTPQTQFSRALKELGIEWIAAGSPQAKGRVERFNGTAQDRLVKELRLAKARTIQEANEVLDKRFLPLFNRRFTVKPASRNNAHRPLHPSMQLASILSIQHRRQVGNDYTIQLDKQLYQLLPPALSGLRRGWVIVERRVSGKMHIRFKDRYLKFELCQKPSGALPPNPRSLTHVRTPAELAQKEGLAAAAAKPSAVRPAPGRSGRTPAEPCPPKGRPSVTPVTMVQQRRGRVWMKNFRLPGTPTPDILTLAK